MQYIYISTTGSQAKVVVVTSNNARMAHTVLSDNLMTAEGV